jgi:hypothetical protein
LTVNHGNCDTSQALKAAPTTIVLVYIRQLMLFIGNLIERIK